MPIVGPPIVSVLASLPAMVRLVAVVGIKRARLKMNELPVKVKLGTKQTAALARPPPANTPVGVPERTHEPGVVLLATTVTEVNGAMLVLMLPPKTVCWR